MKRALLTAIFSILLTACGQDVAFDANKTVTPEKTNLAEGSGDLYDYEEIEQPAVQTPAPVVHTPPPVVSQPVQTPVATPVPTPAPVRATACVSAVKEFSGCQEAARKFPSYVGTKCVYVCNGYFQGGGCQNSNPNVCAKETSPGKFEIYSWADGFSMMSVSLPYQKQNLVVQSYSYTVVRAADSDSDCAMWRGYNPEFEQNVRRYYPPNQNNFIWEGQKGGSYENFISRMVALQMRGSENACSR